MTRSPPRDRRARLLLGLAFIACCSGAPSYPTGLLATPAGLTLSNTLLFISNQDQDELHAFDTQAAQYVPAPNVLFPLSVPTVRRPGAICADRRQLFVASTAEPKVGVVDAFNDSSSHLPLSGLRELGELVMPATVTALGCAPAPEAVVAHETAVAGSPAAYRALIDAGELVVDGVNGLLPDGGPDERHALAALPTAAIAALSPGGGPTTFYEVENDITGAACPDAGPIEGCAGASPGAVCAAASFCPTVSALLTLPSQPAACAPLGVPLVSGFDIAGGSPGTLQLGAPSAEPAHANLLVAADRSSTCAAAVDLGSGRVSWMQAGAPLLTVAALPYFPNTCVPGGTLFAAALDSEACERTGPPPPGGYNACNGIVFFNPSADNGSPDLMSARLPAPLPYPFQRSPARPMPPVRVNGIVRSLAFAGPSLSVGQFNGSLTNPVPIQVALIAGTTVGDMAYIDVGFGSDLGGTGSDGGGYPCPPAYFAPRIFDQTDYVPGLGNAAISAVTAVDGSGASLSFAANADQPMTAAGKPLPASDRLGAPFAVAPAGHAAVTCYGVPGAAADAFDLCVTDGMVQHGAAEDETITVTYQGAISGLAGLGGSVNGATLQSNAGLDFTTYLAAADGGPGLLVAQPQNLVVDVTAGGTACGDYLIASVQPSSLTLAPESSGPPLACAQGNVTFTVLAGGAAPYSVQGTESGFIGLWPADGTLHFVEKGRWQYPADLIGMARGAQQLTDLVYGPIPSAAAPGSTLAPPRPEDYDALDSAFGLALFGVPSTLDGPDGGLPDAGVAAPGTAVTLTVVSGVQPLAVNPEDTSALIDAMAAYTDQGGIPHVYGSYRGNNTLVELNPDEAIFSALTEIH
ncbi:MAG: hypothetical protein ACYDCL_22220 [Myxococcales bacterium]